MLAIAGQYALRCSRILNSSTAARRHTKRSPSQSSLVGWKMGTIFSVLKRCASGTTRCAIWLRFAAYNSADVVSRISRRSRLLRFLPGCAQEHCSKRSKSAATCAVKIRCRLISSPQMPMILVRYYGCSFNSNRAAQEGVVCQTADQPIFWIFGERLGRRDESHV